MFCAPSSRVGSAGCGTTRFGSRQNLPSWQEISTTLRPSTVVRPPSVPAPLPPWAYASAHKHTFIWTDVHALWQEGTAVNSAWLEADW